MTDDLFSALSSLDDAQWRRVILQSAARGVYGGYALPAVPPFEFQRRFNVATDSVSNLAIGHQAYRAIVDALRDLERPLGSESRILDFGCGWGRVARFFLHDVRGENLFGIDIYPPAIESCRQSFTSGTFRVNDRRPPSGFEADAFDLVYAVSVFSHLPEPLHLCWLEEIARVLRPGGVLVATTLDRSFIERSVQVRQSGKAVLTWEKAAAVSFDDPQRALDAFDAGDYVFSPMPAEGYGLAVIPDSYVRRHWTRWLNYERFVDDRRLFRQVVIVMTKPGGG